MVSIDSQTALLLVILVTVVVGGVFLYRNRAKAIVKKPAPRLPKAAQGGADFKPVTGKAGGTVQQGGSAGLPASAQAPPAPGQGQRQGRAGQQQQQQGAPVDFSLAAMPTSVDTPGNMNTRAGFDAPGLTGAPEPTKLGASMASDLDKPSEAIVWKGSHLAAKSADESPTARYSTLSTAEVRDLQDIQTSRVFDANAYVGPTVLKRAAAV